MAIISIILLIESNNEIWENSKPRKTRSQMIRQALNKLIWKRRWRYTVKVLPKLFNSDKANFLQFRVVLPDLNLSGPDRALSSGSGLGHFVA